MQLSQLIIPALIVGVFYLLAIRPQQRQAKRQREMIAGLQPGDSIVTIGGIFATIVSVTDERLRVAVADGSELEIATRAVGDVIDGDESDDDSDEMPGIEDSSK